MLKSARVFYHSDRMPTTNANPGLGIESFRYSDLYDLGRLEELASLFDRFVEERDASLFRRFSEYRSVMQHAVAHGGLDTPQESELLISVARDLGAFLINLFSIDRETASQRARAQHDGQVARFKKDFVTRRVAKVQGQAITATDLEQKERAVEILVRVISGSAVETDPEYALAVTANRLMDIERDYPRSQPQGKPLQPTTEARAAIQQVRDALRSAPAAAQLLDPLILRADHKETTSPEEMSREAAALHTLIDLVVEWASARWRSPKHPWKFDEWTSFRLPRTLQFDRLVDLERADPLRMVGDPNHLRRREGFKLTDPRFTPRQISDEANYCIFCHERKKDSCAHGFADKTSFKPNPLGVPLEGCPLDEKIGEMNRLRADGESIASLAMVMIDNPMCPGTGHRICNDCMKACIFQKQEPVNIPQIETGVVTDVIFLPWGFEIYSLLTRWNPLHVLRPVAAPYNGHNVLVVGLGPAGYTLAHYLANEGFGVVGIDGLKLEPLPEGWAPADGSLPAPIRDARILWDQLDQRVLAGFGGVSEYGITVRWDKNFLQCVRVALERRANIRFYGGVRFGGTLTIEDAFDSLGFDHIAIAAGAGTPTIVRMKNNLIRGIRKASDFLMALQLTGAFKKSSMANLQVRLPAVVIGGGLTAIDTATELFAYYPLQVEKILERYETLSGELGVQAVRAGYDPEELLVLDEFLAHAQAVRDERARAAAAGEKPDFIPLVRAWGGVTIAYRKSLLDSPAYRVNYEEVAKAVEEGIAYAENLSPAEAVPDDYGHLKSIIFEKQIVEDGRWKDSGEVVELPARSLMVAAGTSPNVIYEKEHPGTFKLDKYNQFFQSHSISLGSGSPELIEVTNPNETGFFTSYQHPANRSKLVTFYGDNHPRYAGNVVKAMASAKFGYRQVIALFAAGMEDLDRSIEAQRGRDQRWSDLVATLDDGLVARVAEVNRLTPTIVEVVVRAPFASRHFEPGQFYRLQNFESLAREVGGTRLVMEGIALTGASTRPDDGLLSLIILELGGSSRLCAHLRKGEPVVVMGPTGTSTEIPRNETVLLAGGGLGNAVLFSIAKALKDNGCTVVYFAGYKKAEDVFKRDEIEAGTHQVIWAVDRGEPIRPRRPQDFAFVGNIVQAIDAYATGKILGSSAPRSLGDNSSPEEPRNRGTEEPEGLVDLRTVTRLIAIGSDGMMRAVKDARHGILAAHLSPHHVGIGSINSPMQCMMKQVCAQCLQRHVDPATGKESFVFSCFNQDQHLDEVDFNNLRARLRQNTVVEKLTNLWLTRLLAVAQTAVGSRQ
jgi:NADPH-dependent glutamate synthase beta subunit-like oxidoreductase/NAD(P)H-flavin reductase